MDVLGGLARDLRPSRTASADTAVTLEVRMAELGVPGVGVALVLGGRIAEFGCFGARRAGGAAVAVDTLLQAASISKLVAALTALRLVASGRLDLEADIAGSLKAWSLPGGRRGQPVTLRRLLNHTAGTTVHGFPGYPADAPLPTLVQILDGASPCNTPPIVVDQMPGTAWRYSGGGFLVVQKIIEDVTGQPFADVAEELVLAPLAMRDSTFAQPLPSALAARAASPHDGTGTPLPEGAHVYPELAAAGLWSTPADLARLALAIQRAATGAPDALLPADLARQMLEPGLGSWGLGPALGGSGTARGFGHNGATAGFRSWLWCQLDGAGLVVMTNGDNGQVIAEQLFWAGARAGLWP